MVVDALIARQAIFALSKLIFSLLVPDYSDCVVVPLFEFIEQPLYSFKRQYSLIDTSASLSVDSCSAK